MTKLNAEKFIENSFKELESLTNRISEIHYELFDIMLRETLKYSGQDERLMEIVDELEDGFVDIEEAMNLVKQRGILDDFVEDIPLEK